MKHGQKIKYCSHVCNGTEVIKTAYVLRDDGDHIWISETKDELKGGFGVTISREDVRQ